MRSLQTFVIGLIFWVGAVFLLLPPAQAGILGGHFDDFKSRFTADQIIEGDVVAKGSFRDDDRGQDFLHRGSGGVSIKVVDGKRFVQLESDFTSTPGPDYHVYVSFFNGIEDIREFNSFQSLELGKLIKGSGASFYEIPDGATVRSVTIVCKQFNAFITSADLQ